MLANEKSMALTKEFNEYYPGNHSNLRHTVLEATKHKVFITHAKGSHMWDIDGNEYIEFTSGLGPTLLGNCDDEYVASLTENIKNNATILSSGVFFGEDDVIVARKLAKYIPCGEQFKFATTGTEAVQVAFRIARAYTGKTKIVRFVEHYHGWFDNVLGGLIKLGPDGEYVLYDDPEIDDHYSKGTSPHSREDLIVLPWNDFDALRTAFERHHDEIAIIHFEPIVCNTFGMYPKPGFLELIRELCDKYNIVMSFDEVITGFRLGLGGAQEFLGVTPDICTMGKAISGGLPTALVAGKKKIMSYCFCDRKVIAPGTFNGWNLGMRAIATTMEILERDDCARYKNMLKLQELLTVGILKLAEKYKLDIRITEAPGVLNTIFGVKGGRKPVYTLNELEGFDMEFMTKLRNNLQQDGLIMMPAFRWYMTLAHTQEDIDTTLAKMDKAIGEIVKA
jgi:glutamate-1-semialdehyde 2,1-aminomutase